MSLQTPLLSLIQARRSTRVFAEKPVEREKILTCVEAARFAPSAENLQPWRFFVLDDTELIQQFGEQSFSGIYRPTRWAIKAPVLIAMAAKMDILVNRLGRYIQGTSFYLLDLGIAGEHLILEAHELGLGTCWIGWFNSRKAKRFLKLPFNHQVVALIAMGYPAKPPSKTRKLLGQNEIVQFNFEEVLKSH
jgi:nitroreductase